MKTPTTPGTPPRSAPQPSQDPTLAQFLQHTRLLFQRRMPNGPAEPVRASASTLQGLEVSESSWAEWEAASKPAR